MQYCDVNLFIIIIATIIQMNFSTYIRTVSQYASRSETLDDVSALSVNEGRFTCEIIVTRRGVGGERARGKINGTRMSCDAEDFPQVFRYTRDV